METWIFGKSQINSSHIKVLLIFIVTYINNYFTVLFMYIISFIQKQSFRKHTASTKLSLYKSRCYYYNVILLHYVGTDNTRVVSLDRKAGLIRAGLIP